MNIVQELHSMGVIKKGEFILKSGEKSDFYIDMRKAISSPILLKEISRRLYVTASTYSSIIINCIAGVPMGGIPYAAFISALYDIPMVMIRKTSKTHGTCQLIEGNIDKATPITLVEDVITTGQSLLDTIKNVENEGFKINMVITIVEREKMGVQMLRNLGYNVVSLFTKDDLLV